ncbi:MAG: MFS transporter [Geminicoccaceae bacterium]
MTGSANFRLVIVAMALLTVSALWVSFTAFGSFERALGEPLTKKSAAIADAVAASVDQATGLGVPFDRLRGVDLYLDDVRAAHPEVAAIDITSIDGETAYRRGEDAAAGADHLLVTRPLRADDLAYGEVRVSVDRAHLQATMADVRYDILVVLIVAVVIANEFLALFSARIARRRSVDGGRPAASKPIDPALIRLPLFIFMFAEELSRSFLPLYAAEMGQPSIALDPAFTLGLPITLFMLTVACATPVAGWLVDRFGVKRILIIGMVPGLIGCIGTAGAETLWALIGWRALTAIAYAVMFIAAQGFVARHSSGQNRTKSMALFVVAVVAAGVCGMSVGGILADHIGHRQTFLLSAALILLSMLLVAVLLPAERKSRADKAARAAKPAVGRMMTVRLAALLLFAAIPAKLLLTGYLFYLVPILLEQAGSTSSATGRVMMLYGLAILAVSPLAARLSDRLGRPEILVALGCAFAGAGPLLSVHLESFSAAIAGVALVGLGHALASAPQLALVPTTVGLGTSDPGGLAGLLARYRLVERSGAILGPLVAAFLVAQTGAEQASSWLGAGMLVCAIGFSLVFLGSASARKPKTAEPRGSGPGTRRAVAVLVLAGIFFSFPGDAQAAKGTADDPYRVAMVLWRGETEVERGFRSFMAAEGIAVETFVFNVDRNVKRIPDIVDQIRDLAPDLVYTWGTSVTLGVVGAHDSVDPETHITDIPAIFTLVADPVGAKIVPNFASSGRNVTGTAFLAPLDAQLRTIEDYEGELSRIGVIYNPKERNSVLNVRALERLAEKQGFALDARPVPLSADEKPDQQAIPGLVAAIAEAGAQTLYIGPDSFLAVHGRSLTQAAIDRDLATFAATERPLTKAQAMMGLVSNYYALGKFVGFKALRLLEGQVRAIDSPIESLSRFSLMLNMDVARRIERFPPMSMIKYAVILGGTDEARAEGAAQ